MTIIKEEGCRNCFSEEADLKCKLKYLVHT